MGSITSFPTVSDTATRGNFPSGAAHGTMAELIQMFGHENGDFAQAAQIQLHIRRIRSGENLVHEGAPADAVFFIRSGTFKVFRTDEDGYEQVLAFAARGEVLGFDALCMTSHPSAMQALEDSTVYVVPRRDLDQLSHALPLFAEVLQNAGSLMLARSRELVDILAAVASDVRLARFLIQLSRRMASSGQSPRRFLLRMGRREIASLLGVAHETVSRCFTGLAAMGLLHVDDREVEILNMEELKAFSRSTRRHTDDLGHLRPANRQRATARSRATQHALAA